MPHILPDRWLPGGVDEAVANHLADVVVNLNSENLGYALELFRAALAAGFAEPIIAHAPALLRTAAPILQQQGNIESQVRHGLLAFITAVQRLERARLNFVEQLG